jgi:RNA polymerase sigma-70 factor (ECF subfamily)
MKAFEQLVYRYEQRIYRFACNACSREPDARELTQDTFVKAFRAIAQYNPEHSFAAWLFTIARHKCIDHLRVPRPFETHEIPELADGCDPGEMLSRNEEQLNFWALARNALSPAQFQALWFRYVEDLSVAEIARILRLTQTHVKVLLFRARISLGKRLKPLNEFTDGSARLYEILAGKV